MGIQSLFMRSICRILLHQRLYQTFEHSVWFLANRKVSSTSLIPSLEKTLLTKLYLEGESYPLRSMTFSDPWPDRPLFCASTDTISFRASYFSSFSNKDISEYFFQRSWHGKPTSSSFYKMDGLYLSAAVP